jgi:hypothetical protein
MIYLSMMLRWVAIVISNDSTIKNMQILEDAFAASDSGIGVSDELENELRILLKKYYGNVKDIKAIACYLTFVISPTFTESFTLEFDNN